MPEGTEGTKVLVAREIVSRCTFAHVVKCKGVGEDRLSVDCLVRDIEWMGFIRIMLRSDNEKAIVAFLKESLRACVWTLITSSRRRKTIRPSMIHKQTAQ